MKLSLVALLLVACGCSVAPAETPLDRYVHATCERQTVCGAYTDPIVDCEATLYRRARGLDGACLDQLATMTVEATYPCDAAAYEVAWGGGCFGEVK